MKQFEIEVADEKWIKVEGKTLLQAVRTWGEEHPGVEVECGLLVRVREKGINYYWSGEKFLEALG